MQITENCGNRKIFIAMMMKDVLKTFFYNPFREVPQRPIITFDCS